MTKIAVHDPRGYPPKVTGKRLAPRLPSLDGKTVYLVDCLFDNSDVFMQKLHAWFGEQWRLGEAAWPPDVRAIFDELGLTTGLRRSLLESESFRRLLLEEPPLAAAA